MADWALSTNLYTWAQVGKGFFGWPASGAEAELIRSMTAGDLIAAKFAQSPVYGDEDAQKAQRRYCEAIDVDFDEALADYNATVANGAAALPFVLRVVGPMSDDDRALGEPWARVEVEKVPLANPLSTQEFLRHRAIPPTLSAQFKGTVSNGRHVQKLPKDSVKDIILSGQKDSRDEDFRRYTLVRASTSEDAASKLDIAERAPTHGDRAFLVTKGSLLGVHEVNDAGELRPISQAIPRTPSDLLDLLTDAQSKSTTKDAFSPSHAKAACHEMQGLLDGAPDCLAVDDFGRWHDRYEVLVRKVTQAEELAARPVVPTASVSSTPDEGEAETPDSTEVDEAAALAGLTVEAVRQELAPEMAVSDAVLAEAVTALRAGKHLMLGGPPGTGKSTVAEALCRAVMGTSYEVTTATADWTTFDTIGGYLPTPEAGIRFAPGVVLRSLKSGSWLVIDELNRADIDKAFGPLFTLLSGSGGSTGSKQHSSLPYVDEARRPVVIEWAESRGEGDKYVITPTWRIIGTLNVSDKASLFQLSFAFLRRFAVVDIPLPDESMYRDFIETIFEDVPDGERTTMVEGAMLVAFGPQPIGPAIIADVARFVQKALSPGVDGTSAFDDSLTAFLTAVRLMVVPQYEGSDPGQGAKLVAALRDNWPEGTDDSWAGLRTAFQSVELR